jgi:hypothetical protein
MSKPIGKHRQRLRIDAAPDAPFGVSIGNDEGQVVITPPAPPTIPAPTGLDLTTTLTYSAVTSGARIVATWAGLETYDLEYYVLELATDSGFTALYGAYTTAPNQNSASVDGLPLNTTYYGRVRTIVGTTPSDWSATDSVTTPAADTVAPSAPSGQAAAFINAGDLVVTWTNPTSANFRDVEIKIYESASKVTNYATLYDATGRRVWTAAENLAATSGVGDPSLYVELRSRNWFTAFSSAVNASATKSAPTAPTVTHNWTGDAGTAGPDLIFSWAAISDAAKYRVALNGGTARDWAATTYPYTLEANRAQNTTADPTISYSITAVDGLSQSSSAATGTATNAAPAAPTATLTQGAVSGLQAAVTSSPPADFLEYEFVFKRDGSTVATILSKQAVCRYEGGAAGDEGYHSWTVVIRQKDAFAQFSSTVTPSAVTFEWLSLSYLRSQVEYSDSIATAAATLKSALSDNVTDSGGVSYSA